MDGMAQSPLGLHTQEEWLETQHCPLHPHDDQHSDHEESVHGHDNENPHESVHDDEHPDDDSVHDDEYPRDSVHDDEYPDGDYVHDDDQKKLIVEYVDRWPGIGQS